VTHLQVFSFFLCKARSEQQLCYRAPMQRNSDRVAKDWGQRRIFGWRIYYVLVLVVASNSARRVAGLSTLSRENHWERDWGTTEFVRNNFFITPQLHLDFIFFPFSILHFFCYWTRKGVDMNFLRCWWSQGFFLSISWCSHSGDHPQEELAKFGYKTERKIGKLWESCYILATCCNLLSIYGNFRKNSLEIWWLSVHSFHKNPLYESDWNFSLIAKG
jgi:hypothetical protein